MNLDPDWEYVADTVMGGVSTGQLSRQTLQGCDAMRLTGGVSLDNNGGFIQMAFDLKPGGTALDASGYAGIEMQVLGNDAVYDLRLRTDALTRPWQSFRTEFVAPSQWTNIRVPFGDIVPHRTEVAFDPAKLRRIGIVAIGREFHADVAVCEIGFYH